MRSTAITSGHTTPWKPSGHYEILAPSFYQCSCVIAITVGGLAC